MKESDLDKLVMDDRISPEIRSSILNHHSQEQINKETGYLFTLVGGIIILGALACYHYSNSNQNNTIEPQKISYSK